VFEGGHVPLEVTASDKAPVDQLLANIVDEVQEDRSSVMAWRIDVDDRVDTNICHARSTKQAENV